MNLVVWSNQEWWPGAPTQTVTLAHSEWCVRMQQPGAGFPRTADACAYSGDHEIFRLQQGRTVVVVPCCRLGGFGGRIRTICNCLEQDLGYRLINHDEAWQLFQMRADAIERGGVRTMSHRVEACMFDDRLADVAAYHSSYTSYWFLRDVARLVLELKMPRIVIRCRECQRRWRFSKDDWVRDKWQGQDVGPGWCSVQCRERWTDKEIKREREQERWHREEQRWLNEGRMVLKQARRWLRDRATKNHEVLQSPVEE